MNLYMLLLSTPEANVLNCHIFVSESANQFVPNLVFVGITAFPHHLFLEQKFIL